MPPPPPSSPSPLQYGHGVAGGKKAAKKWHCPRCKVLPITMGATILGFKDVHCNGEQHKGWLQYGKVVPGYFPHDAPKGSRALLGMMFRVNESPLLRAASAGGALAAATMAALAHLTSNVQLLATNDWLDPEWGLSVRCRDLRRDCLSVLHKQVTTLPRLSRMYPIMRSTYQQPRGSSGIPAVFTLCGAEVKHVAMGSWMLGGLPLLLGAQTRQVG